MTRATRRRRLRVFVAASSALAIGAGLVLAISVAGGAPHAAANPSGASPTVYVTGLGNGNGGRVATLSLAGVLGGGAGAGAIAGFPAGSTFGPVALNSTAADALVGVSTAAQTFDVAVVNVATGSVLGLVPITGRPIGFAMDPTHPANAWVLETNGKETISRIDIGASTATPLVFSLPAGPNQGPVTPTSIAVTPDGGTLVVGWGQRDFYGVDSMPAVPQPPVTQWSVRTGAFNRVVDVAIAPGGHHLFAAQTDGFQVSTAFELTLPLPPPGSTTWSTDLPAIAGVTQLSAARALTVSPDGQRVFVGGTSGNAGTSAVASLLATSGAAVVSKPIDMTTNSDGVGGLAGISASPDGRTLVVAGFDSRHSQMRLFPVSLPNLGASNMTVLPNFGSSDGPQDIAITPDQAPIAHLGGPAGAQVGQSVTFDASTSTVKYGTVTTFAWNFGDGGTTTTSSPTVNHTFTAPGNPMVSVTDTDSAGTSVTTGVAGVGAVDGPGQTPYRRANPLAQTSIQIVVTATPPTSGPTTTVHGHPATTSTTIKGHPATGVPVLVLKPALGAPGTIVTVTGHGFKAGVTVIVSWSVSTGAVAVTSDVHGNLPATPLLILTPDVLGPRFALASSTPQASAPFLVVPSSSEPGGSNGGLLFRSEGP